MLRQPAIIRDRHEKPANPGTHHRPDCQYAVGAVSELHEAGQALALHILGVALGGLSRWAMPSFYDLQCQDWGIFRLG